MKQPYVKKTYRPKIWFLLMGVGVAIAISFVLVHSSQSSSGGLADSGSAMVALQSLPSNGFGLAQEAQTIDREKLACNDAGINPFSSHLMCDASLPTQAFDEQDKDAEFRKNRFLLIDKALGGDAATLPQYVQAYSRQCRDLPPQISSNYSECMPSVLAANDARFIKVAENLAATGDAQAQFALGQWYMFTASLALAKQQSESQPSAQDAAVDTSFQTPEFQKAAYFFAQASSVNPNAKNILSFLESIGVKPNASP